MPQGIEDAKSKEQTPAEKPKLTGMGHVLFFADKDGNLTRESMAEGMRRLGGSAEQSADRVSNNVMLVAAASGCPHARFFRGGKIESEHLPKIMHPEDTGIIDKNGNYDEVRYNALAKYAVEHKESGKKVVSLDLVSKYKAKDSEHTERWGEPNCLTRYFASSASQGEFTMLLDRSPDVVEINGVKHIPLDRLQQFYAHGKEFFEEIAERNKKGPAPK